MKMLGKGIIYSFLFLFLTIISQIGGIVLLISLSVNQRWKRSFKFKYLSIFLTIYLLSVLLFVPIIAPIFGREKVAHSDKIQPATYMTILLNRNYVKPELNELLQKTADNLENTNVKILYLDACFPFIDKFPLLPHLSHNDGKKIDLNLVYENGNGEIKHQRKSISGYGVFESPKPNEFNQTAKCKNHGYWQYDFTKYLTLGKINRDLKFSNEGNRHLMRSLLRNKELGKIFIEPHLKQRLQLNNSKIRFHGCGAVRHDDHIHVQL
ncbi:MAG: hypothetical protein AB8G11_19980 [Saprospiraceae bacterium]